MEFNVKIMKRCLESHVARESEKVLKARIRLAKRIAALDSQVTPKAIKDKSVEIRQWIARHANQRSPLRLKHVRIFDTNQNSAPISKIVENFLMRIGCNKGKTLTDIEVESK